MKRLIHSSLVASGLGALVALALALVISGIGDTAGVPGFQAVSLLFAIFCPPWELFWAGIAEPHNLRLWTLLSATVVAANALLYIPAGLAHAATAHLRSWIRYSVVVAATFGSLGLGHVCFIP